MTQNLDRDIANVQEKWATLKSEISRVLVGQDDLVQKILVSLVAQGHVLLEGVPGLAKTLVVRTLAQCIDAKFSRIQFTPDMLPGDVIGTQIFNPKDATFSIKKGPVFGHFILADEINRAPAKVQSALLEAMQERQVTLGDQTLPLEKPFMVLATQNPIEQEGTYPLPEAQLDRFMFKLLVKYLSKEDEIKVIDRMAGMEAEPKAKIVMSTQDVLDAQALSRQIFIDDKVKAYVVDLVFATRNPKDAGLPQLEPLIENGASTRATLNLIRAGKALALLQGRTYLSPHDIKRIAPAVLRHRIMRSYEAEAQGQSADDIIDIILENIEVP